MTQAIFPPGQSPIPPPQELRLHQKGICGQGRPMAMAMGPVTVAGRILLMESLPKRLTSPAAMETGRT